MSAFFFLKFFSKQKRKTNAKEGGEKKSGIGERRMVERRMVENVFWLRLKKRLSLRNEKSPTLIAMQKERGIKNKKSKSKMNFCID